MNRLAVIFFALILATHAMAHKPGPGGDLIVPPGIGGGGTVTGDVTWNDDIALYWGTSNDSVCLYDTTQTPDSLVCGVSTDSSRLLITTQALAGVSDLAHALASYPTVGVTDSTGADIVELGHDGTDAQLTTNAGSLTIDSATTIALLKPLVVTGGADISGSVVLANDEFISNSVDGKITMGGGGGTNNEDLTYDFEASANQVAVTSSTGTTLLTFGSAISLEAANFVAAAGGVHNISGRWALGDTGVDGQLKVADAAGTTGVVLDINDAADTLTVKDLAGTGTAAVDVTGALTVGGDITMVNGESISNATDGVINIDAGSDFAIGPSKKLQVGGAADTANFITSLVPNVISLYINNTSQVQFINGQTNFQQRVSLARTGDSGYLQAYHDAATTPNGTDLYEFVLYGKNSTPALHSYGLELAEVAENTAGDEDGKRCFKLTDNGTEDVDYLCLDATDGIEAVVLDKPLMGVNGETIDNNTDGIWTLDSGSDIAFGPAKKLQLRGPADTNDYITSLTDGHVQIYSNGIMNFDISAGQTNMLGALSLGRTSDAGYLQSVDNAASTPDGSAIFEFHSLGKNDAVATHEYANDIVYAEENAAGDEDGSHCWYLTDNGTEDVNYLCLDASDGVESVVLGKPLVVPTYTHNVDIDTGAAVLGPTAPDFVTQDGWRYLEHTDGEISGGAIEVPTCWTADSDLSLSIYWAASASAGAIAAGETVIWNCDYRVITWGTDTTEGGNATAVSISDTYTQSGAGVAKATHESELTIDYDHATHPVAVGDDLVFECERDSGGTDTYAGGAMLRKYEITFDCSGIPNH